MELQKQETISYDFTKKSVEVKSNKKSFIASFVEVLSTIYFILIGVWFYTPEVSAKSKELVIDNNFDFTAPQKEFRNILDLGSNNVML